MTIARVYMGFDSREVDAYHVAGSSIIARSTVPVLVLPVMLDRLADAGMIGRHRLRWVDGRLWDEVSQSFCSTEFAVTRFLVPLVGLSGWVLFCDCDVVFLADVAELLALADDRYAVMCVQHDYTPSSEVKMDAQVQARYPRKNWSSVMLVNCDHPGNRRLTLGMIDTARGRELHGFAWLHDNEIGALPARWNWLVGEQPKPADPAIAHFTLGGPWLPNWTPREHDDIWTDEHARHLSDQRRHAPGS